MDAKKVRYAGADALKVARQVDELWVAKGKNVRHLQLKRDKIDDEELLKLILGPSGNLRAPVIRRGRKMFIGFEPNAVAQFLDE